ncbi:MAG TPA: 2-hydroxyacyl-CoA dehydratase family protein [Caulobacterales bacterium]|nr:2-hydroxyacyl-CoA dehydratase family protein [Caulobacterales bacterium]
MPLEAGHFAKLKAHYTDRARAMKQARAQGGRIVARVGSAVPAELILAAGFMPVLVAADRSRAAPTAAKYIDDVVPPETHALFEAAAQGDFDEVELLVLSRVYDKLYFYLKEIYRQGLLPGLPPLHMFDLMQNRRAALTRYNEDRLLDLRLRLERAAGAPISDAALREAIVLCNRARAAQRALLDLRWQGHIDGEAAMQAIGAGYFMHPADYAEALEGYLAQLHAGKGAARPRLLLATAEPLTHTTLHEAVERAGGRIVAEDDWWGARAPGGDVSLDLPPMEALLAKYCFDTATADSYPVEDRLAWFEEAAQRSDVDGVIFYIPPSDLQYGWDYPRLRARLQEQAKPFLLIRQDASTSSGRVHLAEEAANFIGQIRGSRVDKAGAAP